MAEDSRALTTEQKEEIANWVREHMGDNPNMPCPVCKHDEWGVGDHLAVAPVVSPGGGVALGGPAYPHALLICHICGFTYFINSVRIGISKAEEKPEEEDQPADAEEIKKASDG